VTLEGFVVADLTQNVAGPFGTPILAVNDLTRASGVGSWARSAFQTSASMSVACWPIPGRPGGARRW
jgi:hypothetical protein